MINHKNGDEFRYSTVVYVTDQFSCESLIEAGRQIANKTKTNLYVVNVSRNNFNDQLPNMEALEFLYQTSHKNKAVMNVFYETDVLDTLKKTAKDYNAINIVTGVPQSENSVVEDFWDVGDEVLFYVVDNTGKIFHVNRKLKKIEDIKSKTN